MIEHRKGSEHSDLAVGYWGPVFAQPHLYLCRRKISLEQLAFGCTRSEFEALQKTIDVLEKHGIQSRKQRQTRSHCWC